MRGRERETQTDKATMVEVKNKQVIFKNYVEGVPKESDMYISDTATIKLKVPHEEEASPSILVKNLYLSCDPVMRIRMRKPGDETSSYFTPFAPGSVRPPLVTYSLFSLCLSFLV